MPALRLPSRVLLLLLCFAASWLSIAQAAQPYSELQAARRAGWDVARTIAAGMGAADLKRFPGVQGWLREFRAVEAKFDAKSPSAAPPAFEVDRLVTRNPAWWRAHFEIAPADTPLMLLQAGLLLAAGEASRASYLLVIARQRPGQSDALRDAVASLLGHSQAALARAGQEVLEAGRQIDGGARDAGAAKLREVVRLWPQNALAHYESGLASLVQQYVAAGRKAPARSQLNLHSDLKPGPDAVAAFVRARSHDPLMLPAYQGNEEALGDVLLVLGRKVRPQWEAIAKDSVGEASDDALRVLASGLQEAGLHELAIAAKQVVVARERGFDESDRRFLVASLRQLVPENQAQAALQRVTAPGTAYLSIVLRP